MVRVAAGWAAVARGRDARGRDARGPDACVPEGRGPDGRGRRGTLGVAVAAGALAAALGCYLAVVLTHPLPDTLTWYDLNVYNDAGLIARHSPGRLYTWQLHPGIKFTYTPFAALVFAAGSLFSWAVLKWLTTAVGAAALLATIWLTLGALGWRGARRAAALLGLAAVGLWIEPVQRALHLGQVELALMVLIVWDLCQSDRRWWKGAGIGVAAGIKLVPLIFIPYLLLSGKLRQAAVACAAFAGTVVIGFAFLPGASVKWWLTGYFLYPSNVGGVGSVLNQSLLALLIREAGAPAATPAWLGAGALTTAAGLIAAAMLHRSGRPVAGWLTCALTGLLVSPISWDHHWVWVVPALVLATDAAVRASGARRWACWLLAAAVAVVYGGWPGQWAGTAAFVPHVGGLIGFFAGPHPPHQLYLQVVQVLSWNLFVLAGLAMFAGLLAAAAVAWRARLPRRVPEVPARLAG
jgi:alpha-1,2-mannosyltransferase